VTVSTWNDSLQYPRSRACLLRIHPATRLHRPIISWVYWQITDGPVLTKDSLKCVPYHRQDSSSSRHQANPRRMTEPLIAAPRRVLHAWGYRWSSCRLREGKSRGAWSRRHFAGLNTLVRALMHSSPYQRRDVFRPISIWCAVFLMREQLLDIERKAV